MRKPLFLRIVGDLEREYPFFNRAEMLEEEKGYLLCKSVRRQFVKWHMGYPLTVWMTTQYDKKSDARLSHHTQYDNRT